MCWTIRRRPLRFWRQTVTLEFRNQPKGSLIIVKKDAVTGKPLKGVTFKVTTSSGEFVPDAEGQISSNGLYYTDENGQIVLSGLAPDTYVITETASISGYVLDSTPQTVVVNTNDTQTLTFTNTPIGNDFLTIMSEAAARSSRWMPTAESVSRAFGLKSQR